MANGQPIRIELVSEAKGEACEPPPLGQTSSLLKFDL